MSKTTRMFFIAFLFLSCAGSSSIAQSNPATQTPPVIQGNPPVDEGKQNRYAEGRIIVKFQEDATTEDIETVKRELHLEVIRSLLSPNLYLMRICDNKPVQTVLELLKANSKVKFAEPDVIYKID
jgi:hypothetical protein